MSQLDILVPVLARPQNVEPLLRSIEATTPDAQVLFLADPDDKLERDAIREARLSRPWVALTSPGGTYPEKINAGVRVGRSPLIFFAADDLRFTAGWFEAATRHLADGVELVGINDLIPRSTPHATHFLCTRDYALTPLLDEGRGPMCEDYRHWYVDNELTATADLRGAYAYAEDAIVEHLHPFAEKAPDDATYRKGTECRRVDRRTFRRRERLWRRPDGRKRPFQTQRSASARSATTSGSSAPSRASNRPAPKPAQ